MGNKNSTNTSIIFSPPSSVQNDNVHVDDKNNDDDSLVLESPIVIDQDDDDSNTNGDNCDEHKNYNNNKLIRIELEEERDGVNSNYDFYDDCMNATYENDNTLKNEKIASNDSSKSKTEMEIYHDCYSTEEQQNMNIYYQEDDDETEEGHKDKKHRRNVNFNTRSSTISNILSCIPVPKSKSKSTRTSINRGRSKSTPSMSNHTNVNDHDSSQYKLSLDFLQSCKSSNHLRYNSSSQSLSSSSTDYNHHDDGHDNREQKRQVDIFLHNIFQIGGSHNNNSSTNIHPKIQLPFTPISYFSEDLDYTNDELLMENGNDPTKDSDLRPKIIIPSQSYDHDTNFISSSSINSNNNSSTGGRRNKTTTVQCRSFHIITSAALPWMTGTAVNPLLRAVYINKMNREAVQNTFHRDNHEDDHDDYDDIRSLMGKVTLCVPWLIDKEDRDTLYGQNYSFTSKNDQEQYMREWIVQHAKLPLEAYTQTNGIEIQFYDAKYSSTFMSILPIGDIRECIGLMSSTTSNNNSDTTDTEGTRIFDGTYHNDDADVCILEEPEHLLSTLLPSYPNYNQTFRFVVGIMHTNYQSYIMNAHVSGVVVAPIVAYFSACLARVHCDKIVKLSDTLQSYAVEKEIVCNVHGIRSDFIEEGIRRARIAGSDKCDNKDGSHYDDEDSVMTKNKIYYIGKLLWVKGLDKLIELENAYKRSTGDYFEIEIIGSGPEADEIKRGYLGRSNNNITKQQRSYSSQGSLESLTKIINEMPKSRHEFRKDSIPATFPGRMDHAQLTKDYKIFVNPSVSEVLCTTTAEVSHFMFTIFKRGTRIL